MSKPEKNTLVATLRMLAFNVAYYLSHIPVMLGLVILLPLPRLMYLRYVKLVMRWFELVERYVLGLTYEMRGAEHLPRSGCYIFACKHQSQWETYKLHNWLGDPAIILKKELLDLPLWGWIARKNRVIAVDRSGRKTAIESLVRGGLEAKRLGRAIAIFPEGTRAPPGTKRPYKFGVVSLYEALQVPIVPVALNSGCYWPKAPFRQRPGHIIVTVLPPISPGLPPADVLPRLEAAIEPAAQELYRMAESGRAR